MGDVVAISALVPGTEVLASGHFVCVNMLGRKTYYDALQIQKVPAKTVARLSFKPLISVPSDADRAVVLVRCDQAFEGDFTPRALRMIKLGAHYVTTLKEGLRLPGQREEVELRCDLGYVLSETSEGAILMGVLSAELE